MRLYKFYRNKLGWFVDLPEWEGEQSELQMVMGADIFLDLLSQSENEVFIRMSTKEFEGSETLEFLHLGRFEGPEIGEGAWYGLRSYMGLDYNLKMWLCDVTKFVFGEFPKKIYFK
jgi:hypothetical protein